MNHEMKIMLPAIMTIFSVSCYANEQSVQLVKEISESTVSTSTPDYISISAFNQNPYIGLPSGGGTRDISESDYFSDSVAKRLFSDGTWNAFAAGSYSPQNGYNNYGYALNLFGQTGQISGFSVGGLMTIANPFFSSRWNPADPINQNQALPVAEQVTPQELFLEYQHDNIVQADIGWIGINNSPWMTYYFNNALNVVTYQGLSVNVNPGGGWLLTGFAINGSQLLGENGFSQQTMYNTTWDSGTATPDIGNAGSQSTYAIGANWNNSSDTFGLRMWDYQFTDYSNLAYSDATMKFPVNNDLVFTIAAQGALQGTAGNTSILNANGYGTNVNSNMLGTQLGLEYSIFTLQLGYNNIWGSTDGYAQGGLISPYTYQYATDPLYTTGWIVGMADRSSGQAYKLSPSLSLLDGNLIVTPSYEYFSSTYVPSSNEYDIQVSYSIPEVKGLTLFGGYGYLSNVDDQGNGFYLGQLMVSYLY